MASWVPIAEGMRMIARHLSGAPSDHFAIMVEQDARGRLLAALRMGTIASEGWRDQGLEREALLSADWTRLEFDWGRGRLGPPGGTMRRVHPDFIVEIVVDADDVRELIFRSAKRNSRLADETAAPASKSGKSTNSSPKSEAVRRACDEIWKGDRSRLKAVPLKDAESAVRSLWADSARANSPQGPSSMSSARLQAAIRAYRDATN